MLEDVGDVEVVGDEAVAIAHDVLPFGFGRGSRPMANAVYASPRKTLPSPTRFPAADPVGLCGWHQPQDPG